MQFNGQIIDSDSIIMKQLSKTIETLINAKFSQVDNPPDNIYYEALRNVVNSVFYKVGFITEKIKAQEMDCETCVLLKTTILFAMCVLILGISIGVQGVQTR